MDLNALLATKMLKIKPFCVFLPKMTAYRKDFDESKYISLLIKDNELLEKYNEIWDKVSYGTGKEFDSNPVDNSISIYLSIGNFG